MPAPKGHPNYATDNLGGRPHAHSIELIEKYAHELDEWMKNPNNVWLKDFALERDVHSSYLSEWAERSERFRAIYNKAKEWQESKITKGSLLNRFNQRMSSMILANHHGWTEKPVQIIVNDNGLDRFKEKLNEDKNPLLKKKSKK